MVTGLFRFIAARLVRARIPLSRAIDRSANCPAPKTTHGIRGSSQCVIAFSKAHASWVRLTWKTLPAFEVAFVMNHTGVIKNVDWTEIDALEIRIVLPILYSSTRGTRIAYLLVGRHSQYEASKFSKCLGQPQPSHNTQILTSRVVATLLTETRQILSTTD